jgi:hypothetical protein
MSNYDLRKAARDGLIRDVIKCIDQGADVNSQSRYTTTALQEAGECDHEDVFALLLSRGASWNSIENAFASACERGNDSIVSLCLGRGANPNTRSSMGTVLHLACWYGHNSVVQLLLSNGANINIENEAGEKPIDLAKQMGRIEIMETINKKHKSLIADNAKQRATSNHEQGINQPTSTSSMSQQPRQIEIEYQKKFESIPCCQQPKHYDDRIKSESMTQKQLDHQQQGSNCHMNYYATSSVEENRSSCQQSHVACYYDYCLSMAHEQWRKMSDNHRHYNHRNDTTTFHRRPRQISQYGGHYTRTNISTDGSNSFLRKQSSFLEDSSDEEESYTNTEQFERKTTKENKHSRENGKQKRSCGYTITSATNKRLRRVTRSQTQREG